MKLTSLIKRMRGDENLGDDFYIEIQVPDYETSYFTLDNFKQSLKLKQRFYTGLSVQSFYFAIEKNILVIECYPLTTKQKQNEKEVQRFGNK